MKMQATRAYAGPSLAQYTSSKSPAWAPASDASWNVAARTTATWIREHLQGLGRDLVETAQSMMKMKLPVSTEGISLAVPIRIHWVRAQMTCGYSTQEEMPRDLNTALQDKGSWGVWLGEHNEVIILGQALGAGSEKAVYHGSYLSSQGMQAEGALLTVQGETRAQERIAAFVREVRLMQLLGKAHDGLVPRILTPLFSLTHLPATDRISATWADRSELKVGTPVPVTAATEERDGYAGCLVEQVTTLRSSTKVSGGIRSTPREQQEECFHRWIGAAECLERLHEAGWIHGDVKAENIGQRADGSLCLLDLSFAMRAESSERREELLPRDYDKPLGESGFISPYQAPEIHPAPSVDKKRHHWMHALSSKSDVYSFAVMVVKDWLGKSMKNETPPATVQEEWVAELRRDGRMPRVCQALLIKALSVDPINRPTMQQLGAALSKAIEPAQETRKEGCILL